MRRWLVIVTAVALVGCGEGCSGSGEPGAGGGTTGSGGSGSDRGGEHGAPTDPGPRPELRIAGAPDRYTRQVELRIENHGDEARLAPTVALQRRDGDEWADVDEVSLELRYSCSDDAPECLTLATGAVLLPPPWLGVLGDAQCECARCGQAEPGTYRFVVQSCGGGHTVEGEPFELAPAR